MKKSLINLFFLLVTFNIIAQENLIPNSGFEEYYGCDYDWEHTPLDSIIEEWYPLNKNPVYLNIECNDSSAIDNWDGSYFTSGLPHSGNGYLRFELYKAELIFGGDTFNDRTYAQVRLLKPLRPDRDYYISYYITKQTSRFTNISHYGINFSDTFHISSTERLLQARKRLNIKAQLEVDTVVDLYPGKWEKISHCFSVDTVFNVMAVGVFAPQESVKIKFDYTVPNGQLPNLVSYDDFLLVEIERDVRLELDRDTICVGECIDLATNHTLVAGEFDWYLPGSQLGESTDSAVTVCYDAPGSYDIGINIEHCTGTYDNYFSKAITVIDSHLDRPLPSDTTICSGEKLVVTIPKKYSVIWEDGDTNNTHIFLQKGEYIYTVMGNYCESTFSISINYYENPYRQKATIYSCYGQSTSFLGKTYDSPGYYIDTIKSVNGCDSIYFDIDYYYYPKNPIVIEGDLAFCEDGQTELKVISPPYKSIHWDDGSQDNPRIIKSAGFYTLKLIDNNQCIQTDTLHIRTYPLPKVTTGDLIDIWYHSGIELPVDYFGDIETYTWSNAEYLDCGDCRNPILQRYFEGVFNVEAQTRHGCKDKGQIKVKFKEASIFIPNVIYNKGQNPINGSLFLQSDIELRYSMEVFDRWGNKLFGKQNISSNQYNEGWQPEGKVNPGVYVYLIEYYENEQEKVIAGDITVL